MTGSAGQRAVEAAAKLVLSASKQQRYRRLGLDAAVAVSEAMRAALPHWSECQLAGEGARALWRRGIEPVLLRVAGAACLARYRLPAPSPAPLGERAMFSCGARHHGLVASLTRFVSFGAAPLGQAAMMALEATALAACRPLWLEAP